MSSDDLKLKIQTINRRLGQLERHNTAWNGYRHDEVILELRGERRVLEAMLRLQRRQDARRASVQFLREMGLG